MIAIVYKYRDGSGQKVSRTGAAYEHVSLTYYGRAELDDVLLQDPNPAQK